MSTRKIFSVFLLCFFFSSTSFVDVFSVEEVIIFQEESEVKSSRFWQVLRYIAVSTRLRELFYPTGVIGPDEKGKTFSSRVWKLTIKGFEDDDVYTEEAFPDGNNVTHLTIENGKGDWAYVVEKFPKLRTLLIRDSDVTHKSIDGLSYSLREQQNTQDIQSIKFVSTQKDWSDGENKLFGELRNVFEEPDVRFSTISAFTEAFVTENKYKIDYGQIIPYEELKADLRKFIVRERRKIRSLGVVENGYAEKVSLAEGDALVVTGDIHGSADALRENLENQRLDGFIADDFSIPDNVRYVCTGDLVDRGLHSVEAVVILVKKANKNNVGGKQKVLIARGNHETREIASAYGLTAEIDAKYPDNAEELKGLIFEVFELLSCAYFLKFPDGNFIQVNHGGSVFIPKPKEFGEFGLAEEEEFDVPDWFANLESQPDIWKLENRTEQDALLWNDYHQGFGSHNVRGSLRFHSVGIKSVEKYYAETRIKLILRGHEHVDYPVGLEPMAREMPTERDWNIGDLVTKTSPAVFRFMSPPEGFPERRGRYAKTPAYKHRGYGVITVGDTYKNSTIRVYKYEARINRDLWGE